MEKNIKVIFITYKKIIIPILLIIGCFFVLFLVILPQIPSISEKFATLKSQNNVISDLKKSLTVVTGESSQNLDSELTTATAALPSSKDISIIFDALTKAASDSNTTLSTFSLNVGGIYGTAAQSQAGTTGTPNVNVVAHVSSSDSQGLVNFATALSRILPLSEITKIEISGGEGTYNINFYYKPIDSAKIARQDRVLPLTTADKSLLNQLQNLEK